jgi:hypothetical protein
VSQTTSRFGRLVEKYRADHQHPVNHFLHVFVGWPMVAAGLFLLPFKPLYSVGLVLGAYAFMFTGHFLFEKNTPTILKNPSTPFVIAWAVIKGIFSGSIKQVVGSDKSNQV